MSLEGVEFHQAVKEGAETQMRRKRMVWLNKLSSHGEYEERIRWKDDTPALSTLKKRSRMKREKNPRSGKLKRMRMRSLKENAAGSTDEEPVGVAPSQPSPGSYGARNGFRESVSGPQQEDGFEEVVMVDEEDEGEKEEKVPSPRRQSAALRFSRRVGERPLTYDELIEGVSRVAFPDDLDREVEVPWEDRLF